MKLENISYSIASLSCQTFHENTVTCQKKMVFSDALVVLTNVHGARLQCFAACSFFGTAKKKEIQH